MYPLGPTPLRPAQEQIFLALQFLSFVFTFSQVKKIVKKKHGAFRGLVVARVVIIPVSCSPLSNFITRPGKLFAVHVSNVIFVNSKWKILLFDLL